MGLSTDIEFYNFYQKYEWLPADFLNFQTALAAYIGLYSGGKPQILAGLVPTAPGLLNVTIGSGVCLNASGYPMYVNTAQTVAVASPAGNPAISLIVARPNLVDNNSIPQPTNPANTVFLNKKQGWTVLVLNGTPAATPAAPATGADDVVLCELHLTSGQTVITTASFFNNLVNGGPKRLRITPITVSTALDGTEDVVEVDCTSGPVTLTLAAPALIPGRPLRVVKIDSSANAVTLSSSAGISGQVAPTLDDQWSRASIYSSGQSYRFM